MWEFGYEPRVGEAEELREGYLENTAVWGFD